MLNSNIIESNFNTEVFSYFKNVFKNNINKKRFLNFTEIVEITEEELGLSKNSLQNNSNLKIWFANINDLRYLNEFISSEFEEIIIHSPECVQVYFKDKVTQKLINMTKQDIFLSIQVLTLRERRDWNQSKPFVSFNTELSNVSCRITTLQPSVHGKRDDFKVFIRKIGSRSISLKDFIKEQSHELLLRQFINNKENILLSGSTGSGKTTLLSSLLAIIEDKEHVIVLEDTQEINVKNDNFTFLLADDNSEYSLEKYTQYALRMRPDRIILGEMRGGEVIPFMLAMNTGHKGLMSSIHANNARDALLRIALLFEMNTQNKSLKYSEVLKLVSNNINYVIHLNNKNISEIIKVIGSDGERITFEYLYSAKRKACNE